MKKWWKPRYYRVGSDCVLYHAYWDGTAKDHSIYGNDGTVYGAVYQGGEGLYFDGTDDYVDCGAGSSLDITGNFSVLIIVKRVEPLVYPYPRFFHRVTWSSDGYDFQSISAELAGGYHRIVTFNNTMAAESDSSGNTFGTTWQVLSCRTSSGAGSIERNAGDITASSATHTLRSSVNTPMVSGPSNPIHGWVREVLVFNVGISNAELLRYYSWAQRRYGI